MMERPMPITGRQDVAAMLHHARISADMTQYQAGEASGCGQPDISAYETGRKVPGMTRILALLNAYGWSLIALPTAAARRVLTEEAGKAWDT
jgi:transcriptional regulator with XRE-family HTH domain